MSDNATPTLPANAPAPMNEEELIKAVGEFNQELVGVLTSVSIPFPIIVQQLLSHAATICVYNNITRAQFMELTRTVFTQIQALNKQGIVKDQPEEPSRIIMAK